MFINVAATVFILYAYSMFSEISNANIMLHANWQANYIQNTYQICFYLFHLPIAS